MRKRLTTLMLLTATVASLLVPVSAPARPSPGVCNSLGYGPLYNPGAKLMGGTLVTNCTVPMYSITQRITLQQKRGLKWVNVGSTFATVYGVRYATVPYGRQCLVPKGRGKYRFRFYVAFDPPQQYVIPGPDTRTWYGRAHTFRCKRVV